MARAEKDIRAAVFDVGRAFLCKVAEARDDGRPRIVLNGETWYRAETTPHRIMTTMGPVRYRRARYRTGKTGASLWPADLGLGLVRHFLSQPAARLALMMMACCPAREGAEFFRETGGMTPSESTMKRLVRTMEDIWESLGPEALDTIRGNETIPPEAVTATVSLDGVMALPRPGEDGRPKAGWREAACGTVSFYDVDGERLDTFCCFAVYLGRVSRIVS